jgi:hypothetical protein
MGYPRDAGVHLLLKEGIIEGKVVIGSGDYFYLWMIFLFGGVAGLGIDDIFGVSFSFLG